MRSLRAARTQADLFLDDGEEPPTPRLALVRAVATATAPPSRNFTWPADVTFSANPRNRYDAFINVLEILDRIDEQAAKGNNTGHGGTALTPDEKAHLAHFSGWASLDAVLAERTSSYQFPRRFELRKQLGDTALAAAQQATLTSYYTPPALVAAIWEGVRQLGFAGGTVLDPAAGSGVFLGMCPPDLQRASAFTLIEKDPTSARICRALYPDATIHGKAIEECRLPESYYDLVIGNVPFGNLRVFDSEMRTFRGPIHDYFIQKAVRKCRPGGLVVLITSAGTLDKTTSLLREKLAADASLIGALRLPSATFEHAGTEVVTDLLVLQKVPSSAESADIWRDAPVAPTLGVPVNAYFARHLHHVLGELDVANSNRYGNPELTCIGPTPEPSRVAALIGGFRLLERPTLGRPPAIDLIAAREEAAEGSIEVVDGVPHEVVDGMLVRISVNGRRAQRLVGLVSLREAAHTLIRAQVDHDATTESVEALRAELNRVYDAFIADFGSVCGTQNQQAFDGDPAYPLLLSLERVDPDTEMVSKAPIFRERTAWAKRPIDTAATAQDAALIALDQLGEVDAASVARLTGMSVDDAREQLLSGSGYYEDPASRRLCPADAYLSGDVRRKLREAEAAAELDPAFARNVDALRDVQPPFLEPHEIKTRLGQAWIPVDDVRAFAKHVTGRDVAVTHIPEAAQFAVAELHGSVGPDYQTARMSFYKLLEKALNQQAPEVYDPVDPRPKKVLNAPETLAARERLEFIQTQFAEWLWSDADRAERLANLYNEHYNCYVDREFDGSHLTFPGMSEHYKPRSNQRNAVWRGLQSDTMMLAHFVGSGKTLILAALAMEKKRLGHWSKPMIVVQNSTLLQFTAEFMRIYPQARVLMMGRDDLSREARRRFVARIATANWDAVIIPHSVFDRIAVYPEAIVDYVEGQLAPLRIAAAATRDGSEQRLLQQQIAATQAKLDGMINAKAKDDSIYFEQLGVDGLLVDEAQAYKNLYIATKMSNVAGVNNSFSQRALNLLIKVESIYARQRGCRGVVFSTATPICNSMSETYVFMQYLQRPLLQEKGLECFDAWAAQFGQRTSQIEVAPEGSGFRVKERFASFHNVPELTHMVRQCWDIVRPGAVPEILVPALEGGKPHAIGVERTPAQAAYIAELAARADAIRRRAVTPDVDNMLKVVSEGRKSALDMRLLDSDADDDASSKVNACVRQVFEIWARNTESRATQLIFCDTNTPSTPGFSVYADIRQKLVARGVPEAEIAFIQEHATDRKRFALMQRVTRGIVRILLGSTEMLGIGTNVQAKLIALHHLDVPWRPDQVEQREGRMVRHGNEHAVVQIFRYVTQGSFDAYMWQTVERKQLFIEQFLAGTVRTRSAEDVSEASLTYAEVKAIASGNPAVRELCLVQMEIRKLVSVLQSRGALLRNMRGELNRVVEQRKHAERRVKAIAADVALVAAAGDAAWKSANSGRLDPLQACESMLKLASAIRKGQLLYGDVTLGTVGALRIDVSIGRVDRIYELVGNERYALGFNQFSQPSLVHHQIVNALAELPVRLADTKKHIEYLDAREADLKAALAESTSMTAEKQLHDLEEREQALLTQVAVT